MARGKFITLEGGEGAGKSTQAKQLATYLETKGLKTILTREVGGSPSAETIRSLWLAQPEGFWDPLTELLLINAARREHLVKTVWPALEQGTWVISDRFIDSTRVYQGIGLKLGLDKIEQLYATVAGEFTPDLTLLLDVPVDLGMKRVADRAGQDDRYQQKTVAFHQLLREGYLKLAASHAQRFTIIDASHNPEIVHNAIQKIVDQRLGLKS
jgi:dTMP kinase